MENEQLPYILKALENKMLYLRPVATTIQLKKACLESSKNITYMNFAPWLVAAIVMIMVTIWSAHENYKMEKLTAVETTPGSLFNTEQKIIEIENGIEKKYLIRIYAHASKKSHYSLKAMKNIGKP